MSDFASRVVGNEWAMPVDRLRRICGAEEDLRVVEDQDPGDEHDPPPIVTCDHKTGGVWIRTAWNNSGYDKFARRWYVFRINWDGRSPLYPADEDGA